MSVKSYQEAVDLLGHAGLDPLPVKRPTIEDIERLERRLKVMLPKSYKAMLSDVGLIQVDRIEFAGLGNAGLDGTTASNVVFATEKYREMKIISNSMIHIGFTGYGPFYFIDCANFDDEGEAPVFMAPADGIEFGAEKISESFGDLLLLQVRELLDDYSGS